MQNGRPPYVRNASNTPSPRRRPRSRMEIVAPADGVVGRFVTEPGDPVEYGQELVSLIAATGPAAAATGPGAASAAAMTAAASVATDAESA